MSERFRGERWGGVECDLLDCLEPHCVESRRWGCEACGQELRRGAARGEGRTERRGEGPTSDEKLLNALTCERSVELGHAHRARQPANSYHQLSASDACEDRLTSQAPVPKPRTPFPGDLPFPQRAAQRARSSWAEARAERRGGRGAGVLSSKQGTRSRSSCRSLSLGRPFS